MIKVLYLQIQDFFLSCKHRSTILKIDKPMKTLRFFLCVSLILTACSIAPTENENFLVLTKSSYETSSVYAVNKQQAFPEF